MNIRRRMILKAFKRYIPLGERILALMDFIDKYGNYDIHTKNRMKEYLRFKKFATQMASSCPMICNTKKKNYHTFVEVKL